MPNIKLKSVVSKIEDVPEAYRDRYVERDGKFYLDEIEIEDTVGLKSELGSLGEQLEAANAELRVFKLEHPVRAAALAAGVTDLSIDDVMTITRRRFDLRDGKIVVLDDDGDNTFSTPEKFFGETYRKLRPKYYEAVGESHGEKTMKRADFNKLPPAERMTFVKGGGGIVDGTPEDSTGGGTAGKKSLTRSIFAKMAPTEQMAHVKDGGTVVD